MGELNGKLSEDFYKDLIEQAYDLIQCVDGNGKFLYVNRVWKEKLGYTDEDINSLSLWDIIHSESLAHYEDVFRKVLSGERVELFETILTTKDSKPLYVEGSVYCKFDDRGNIISTEGIFRDITKQKQDIIEQKKTEQMLAERDCLLTKLSEQVPGVVYQFLMKPNGTSCFPFASEGIRDIYEVTPNQIKEDASQVFNRIHPEDYDKLVASISYSYENLSIWEEEYRIILPSNRQCWVRGLARPEKLSDGSVLWHGYQTDNTERKQAEEWNCFLSTVMLNISDSVMISDSNYKITHINKSAEELFGYKPEELIGQSTEILNSGPMAEETQSELYETVSAGITYLGESLNRRKDGSTFICEYKVTPIIGEGGTPYAYVGIQRDVTEKKKMAEELRDSYDRFDQLAKQSRTIAWEVDEKGLYTYISHAVQDVLGYTPDELIGRMHFYDLCPDAEREALKNEIFDGFDHKKPFNNFVNTLQLKDGGTVYVSTNGIPILNSDGTLKGYRGSDLDITEKKEMEQNLIKEKEQFKTTLLSVGDGVISTDKQGNIIVMNPIAEKLTDWTLEESFGKPLEEVFNIVHELTRETCANPAKKVLDTGEIILLANHTMLISKKGCETPIEDSAAPIKNSHGQTTGVVIVFRDFSEKKEKQQQIEYLSFHDHLTGLYNRRYMEDAIKRLDTGRNLPFTIMVLDVNGLKLTNDAFGHKMGDQLLKNVAKILKKVCRADDVIGRMGGDEFYILLPHTDEIQAEDIKQRIITAASIVKLDSVIVSLAVGYSVKSSKDENIENIKMNADNHMYRDKLKFGKTMRSQTIETVLGNINFKYVQEQIHTERVSQYCEAMASAMNLCEKEINDIEIAGELHDIGKIMVPSELLNKPGMLTAEEFEIIKRHPETGYQILKSVDEYVALAEAVLYHHERWDGTGYPEGLKWEEIPLQARIISVADAYEAMTAKRPFQKSKTKEEAIAELKKCAGTQLDPEIVEVFVKEVLSSNK